MAGLVPAIHVFTLWCRLRRGCPRHRRAKRRRPSNGYAQGMTLHRKDTKSLSHTPVTILTGFLGSGKTTLLNRALRDPAMANTAVVINEFGEVGLDHMLAARSDDTIMVLENGCLCCTVYGDLVSTLNRLHHAREANEIPRFDHVVIETSGLADPSPLIQAFLSDPTLAGLYRIGTVVATVDAVNAPGTLDNHIESVRQIALADRILITKLDLLRSMHEQNSAQPNFPSPERGGAARETRGGGVNSPLSRKSTPTRRPAAADLPLSGGGEGVEKAEA